MLAWHLFHTFCFQNYETTESRIKREFEAYGPIKRVGIIEHPKGAQVFAFRFGKRFGYVVTVCLSLLKPLNFFFNLI